MNQLNQNELRTHVSIVAWLNIASGIFFLLIGVLLFFLLAGIGVATGEGEVFAILTTVAVFVSGLMVVLALPSVVAGYGLLKAKNWGRILAIVLGIFNLINIPIGTVIGLYTLWVLLQQDATDYFLAHKMS